MLKQLKVSVIIPTYNRANLLPRAINSVLNQTFRDFEIVVVDDGSTDNTREILEPFIKSNQIRYFYQKNKGPSAARNLGIKNSKGEYIAFLDSDDEWLPEKLEKQIKLFENSKDKKLGFVGCDVIIVDEERNTTIQYEFPKYKNYLKYLLSTKSIWFPSAILTKKKILEEIGLFDEDLHFGEHWDMWIRIARKYSFDFVPEYLIKYYLGTPWVTNPIKLLEIANSYDYIFQKFKEEYHKFPWLYSSQLHFLGSFYFRLGSTKKGKKLLLKSIKINPLNLKRYFSLFLTLLGWKFYQKVYKFTFKFWINSKKFSKDVDERLLYHLFLKQ